MSLKFMFMGNGDYKNNGCEAITRGTLEVLRDTFPKSNFIDSYFFYGLKDKENFLGKDIITKPVHYPQRWTFKWIVLQIALKTSDTMIGKLLYSGHSKYIDKSAVVLSLGGDNYSLDYGVPRRFLSMGNFIKKSKKPFVIWGASIGPFHNEEEFEKRLIKHFNENVDLIFVREKESYDYLCKKGLEEKTHLMADPAFMMKPQVCSKQEIGFDLPKEYITMNFSELMATCVTNNNLDEWKKICNKSVKKIYEKYNLPIILIPHVANDKEFMEDALFDAMSQYENIIMLDSRLNAAQMKWIISKSICLIAARTHATIAGFSTAVPTLSLGYSIKARGLNKLLFNSEQYLLYCEDITVNSILDKTNLLIDKQNEIRKILQVENAKMKSMALNAGNVLAYNINGNKWQ